MSENKLGRKWDCRSCGAKFYDFGKPEATCPKCGTVAGELEPKTRSRPRAKSDDQDGGDAQDKAGETDADDTDADTDDVDLDDDDLVDDDDEEE